MHKLITCFHVFMHLSLSSSQTTMILSHLTFLYYPGKLCYLDYEITIHAYIYNTHTLLYIQSPLYLYKSVLSVLSDTKE